MTTGYSSGETTRLATASGRTRSTKERTAVTQRDVRSGRQLSAVEPRRHSHRLHVQPDPKISDHIVDVSSTDGAVLLVETNANSIRSGRRAGRGGGVEGALMPSTVSRLCLGRVWQGPCSELHGPCSARLPVGSPPSAAAPNTYLSVPLGIRTRITRTRPAVRGDSQASQNLQKRRKRNQPRIAIDPVF